jgi:hypothetical protein
MKKNISVHIIDKIIEEGKAGRIAMGALKGKASTLGGSIPYAGLIFGPLGGALFGHTVQKRINSMYYACKNIDDPTLRKQCRMKLLTYIISVQKEALGKAIKYKEREKLEKSIEAYEKALYEIKHSNRASGTMEESAKYGALKGGLFGGSIFGGLVQSRIERAFYHCKELPKNLRPKCQYGVLNSILQELRNAAKKEPYNQKIRNKIKEVEGRMDELKEKMQNIR